MSDTPHESTEKPQGHKALRPPNFSMPSIEGGGSNSTFELHSVDRHELPRELKPTWRSLFAFTTRKHAFNLTLGIIFAILAALFKPASAILFGRLFSTLIKYGAGKITIQVAIQQVSLWCIGLTAVGLVAWLVDGIYLSQWMVFGELQATSVREQMFTGLLDKNMKWYDLREDGIGTLLIRIQTQIRELQIGASQPFGLLIYEIFCTIASLVVGLVSSWQLTLVLLATFPVAGLLLWAVSRNLGPAIESQKHDLTIASKHANMAITAINTVKVFNGQDQEVWQYYVAIKQAAKNYLVQARANALQSGVLKFFMIGLFVQGFWYGFHLVRQGLDPGNVVTTFFASLTALQAVEIILPQWLVLTKGLSAGETLKSILTEIKDGKDQEESSGSINPVSCVGDIEVKLVSFAYPSNPTQNVLSESNFFFPAGESTYVVGRSGSGKSTLSNLLLKYYEPSTGEILIDGNPISELKTDWVRENITLVQQQSVLFNETVLQNIAFGKSSPPTEEEIWKATETADLSATLADLANGLDTMIGSNGKSLSGGQQQRVAIARARLRDSPILILDEATSALDRRSREKVNNLVREWRKGRTTIVITHDVAQIPDDEYVYVMENGIVVQEGYRGKLAEKLHGTFASFLPANTPKPSPTEERQYIEQVSLIPPLAGSSGGDSSLRWSRISGIFRHESPPLRGGTFASLPQNRLSVGISSAQANALRAEAIWLSPRIPEDGERFKSPSPKPDLKVPPSHKVLQPLVASPSLPPREKERPLQDIKIVTTRPNQLVVNTIDSKESSSYERTNSSKPPAPAPVPSSHEKVEMQDTTTLREVLGTIWPTLNWKKRAVLLTGFVAAFIVGTLTPAFAYVFALLLKVYYASGDQVGEARMLCLIILGIAFLDAGSSFVYHFCLEYCGQAWVNALRVAALKRILYQPKSWFDDEKNSPGRLTEVLDRNAEEMRNLIGRFVGPIFVASLMLSISIIWSFTISWKLSLVALASAPVLYASTRLFNSVSHKWEHKCNLASDEASTIFTETFANIRVVRALTLERYFNAKHSKATSKIFKIGKLRATYSGILFGLTDSMSFYISALVFFYATQQFKNNELSVEKVLQVIQLLMFGISNAAAAVYLVPQINSSRTTATQMLRLARLPLESHEFNGSRRVATPFPIQMDNLSFAYPSRPMTMTLFNITLTLQPGTCTAIVGPSGSGKSTIASILLGLYPPLTNGNMQPALSFNGVSVEDCSTASLRGFMSLVPQSPALFPSSILSNITYGLPEDHPLASLSSAEEAARDAGIHDFIMSLEQGYNTQIGDGGMGLSGGQAQRIAIARALVRKPKLLVLDEATSALDAVTAEGIREIVSRLVADGDSEMAVVAISHGVEMMKIADEVVMIEAGRVVERGGFEELRRRGGKFARLIGEKNSEEVEQSPDSSLKEMTPVDARAKVSWRRTGGL